MSSARTLINDLTANMFNPSAAAIGVLRHMYSLSEGEDFAFVDANNSVVQMIETSVALGYAGIEADESALRKTYAAMATTMEELYMHMSDEDFIDPFAQPANAYYTIFVGKNEVLNKAMPRDSAGTRKLVLPQDSFITVNGYNFTLQYPIEIRIMPHGGIQVVYDTTNANPIRELESNLLEWEMVTLPVDNQAIEMMAIKVPFLQYKISTFSDTIVGGTKFNKSFSFENQFFYARVWMRGTNNTWTEIEHTHAERVIDPYKVTAKLTVREGVLDVYIPDVYIRSGMAEGDIRVDVYTTFGKMELDLMSFDSDAFVLTYRDIGKVVNSQYYTPLETFSYLAIAPTTVIKGGRNALTFEELRDRVIDNNLGARKVPVSDGQLLTKLNDSGYAITKSIDYVTGRIYHASTNMVESTIKEVTTPIGTVNGIISTTEEELLALSTTRQNGNRITILPETAYLEQDGLVAIDSSMSLTDYRALSPADMVAMANSKRLLFTPFHYVLDLNNDIAECRAYHLDSPEVSSRVFVETNTTLSLDIATGDYAFEKAENGYRLVVVTRSGDLYKDLAPEDLICQLSFTPRGYNQEYAYLDGTFLGFTPDTNEAVFEFVIETNLDIDRNDDLIVTNFTLIGNKPTPIAMMLDTTFNVILGVQNYSTPEYKQSNIDVVLRSDTAKGVTHEQYRIHLGDALNKLWTNVRTIATTVRYQYHETDVLAFWEDDVRKRNPDTNAYEYSIVDDKIVWKYEHLRGDPVLKEDGTQEIKFEAGSMVRNIDGTPVIERPESIGRRIDMFLLDARYYLANTDDVTNYRELVIRTLIDQITVDIAEANKQLLEKTEIFLFPRGTMGRVQVLLEDGTRTTVECENEFVINYYLTAANRRNNELLKTLASTARTSILASIAQPTISTTSIGKRIKDTANDDIVDVVVQPMGPDEDINIMTVIDPTSTLTIGKKLVLNPDNTVGIADDITIGYNKHDNQ